MNLCKVGGLVLDVLNISVGTPLELITGVILRRPTDEELGLVIEVLKKHDPFDSLRTGYEFDQPPTSGPMLLLPQAEWRYWLVDESSFPNTAIGTGLYELERVSRLCKIEIPCSGIKLFRQDGRLRYGTGRRIGTDPFVRISLSRRPLLFDEAAAKQIQTTWKDLSNLDKRYCQITTAIDMFFSLMPFHLSIPMYALGVFAILESVLTHDPKGPYESLTHQIKSKLRLLEPRFDEPLNYAAFDIPPQTIWGLLYSYRSALAHGCKPDFKRKFRKLKDSSTVISFLNDATKALLRHALKEPQLMLDLQAC